MEDPIPCSDLDTIQRRAVELEQILEQCRRSEDDSESDSHDLLRDCALFLVNRVETIVSECSDLGFSGDQDFEAYLGHYEQEINSVEAESAQVSDEIEGLIRTHEGDFNRLNVDIGQLKCSLDFVALQNLEIEKVGADGDFSDQLDSMNGNDDKLDLELLELENQVHTNNINLKFLQDLECELKWLDAAEQIEDAFSGLKVISFDENCIRLSLRTFVPNLEGHVSQQTVVNSTELYANHEILIELLEGSIDLSNVEIFPNDVCIRDILDAAKFLSESSLQWFVTKVQDRIVKHHEETSGGDHLSKDCPVAGDRKKLRESKLAAKKLRQEGGDIQKKRNPRDSRAREKCLSRWSDELEGAA